MERVIVRLRGAAVKACLALAGLLAVTSAASQAVEAARAATAAATAAAPPLPVEAFFGPAELGDVALSPSGRWLAVAVQRPGERRSLAVYDLHGGEPAREIASFKDIDVGGFDWVGDERLVFNVLDTHRGSGDQRLGSGLFTVRRDGSDVNQLILMQWWSNPGQGTRASRRLDATHRLIHVPAQQTAGAETVIVHGARVQGRPYSDWVLKRLNIVTGVIETLNAAEPNDLRRWFFDHLGNPVAAIGEEDGRTTVYERGSDASGAPTRDWKVLAQGETLSMPWTLHSRDRTGQLYVTEPAGPRGERVLKRFDRALGAPEAQAMVAVPGFDFTGQLIEDGADAADPVLGIRVRADAQTTVWKHAALTALQKLVDARLPDRTNTLVCSRCREADRTVVVVSGSDRLPSELWLLRGAAEAPTLWRRLGVGRPAIDPARMAEVAFTRIAARDGLEIPLWLTLPPTANGAAAPAVVLVHGGPWVRGGHWGWRPMQQFLASRGYVVIEPEFRGSTGYGLKHHRAGWKQWGQAMQDDLADAVTWAAQRGLVDPKRVCIAGASYGGYATLMGLVQQPEMFRCGAAWVPLTDLRWLLREGSPDDWSDEVRTTMLPQMIGDRFRDAELIQRHSPIEQAARIKAPVLLAWGEEDQRTPPEQAQAMARALRAAGLEPETVGYVGEGHSWLKSATHIDFARRLEAFLARSLQPAQQAVPRAP